MTIEQSTLDHCNGNKDKVFSIMQKTQQPDILVNRNDIFFKLMKDGYSQKSIAEYFNMNKSTVSAALTRLLQNKNVGYSHEITATLIDEIYKSIPDDNIGLVVEALRMKQFSFAKIGEWFNIDQKRARYLMIKEIKIKELAEFNERRKRIYKF